MRTKRVFVRITSLVARSTKTSTKSARRNQLVVYPLGNTAIATPSVSWRIINRIRSNRIKLNIKQTHEQVLFITDE
jgi:hypothetical protein